MANAAQVDHEIEFLVDFIRANGKKSNDNKYQITFGELFQNDQIANTLESLAGTLKAAKKKKIVTYKAELLLQGVSDKEIITLEKQD
ncbi:unnamed protein product [Didymodactylos carnosus]|nr:unnamed protein product [Didymodactylos carnosus]CAF4477677.1 unnamed protein product [Didymodactylos carnosus]